MTTYGEESGPLAIAHRGGMALGPENTLATFARATALGFRYFETDVHTTRDGHLVLFHDTSLKRLTGVPGTVGEADLGWLRRLRVAGSETIPTLAEAMHSFPDTRFTIDLKDARSVVAMADLLLHNPGWAPRICVAGAWTRWLLRLQGQVPELTTALGWRSLTTLIACSRSYARPPAGVASGSFAHVPFRLGRFPVYAERVVAQAHRLGIRVNVWTVNDASTMHTLLDAGVDGIITDHPDVLREVLIARGQWSPLPAPRRTSPRQTPAGYR
ncbi:glycerophosphodiester phosphodiesterase family protein [Nocardioides gansuensis]|uniref:glycerophosphodiester phosphodiesterase family protein n=1 Tax=Nocardioides gansuensis TaxID=2138300 RepID=UPI001BA7E55C|nr:glycerophosphodiester phosphodiesterase family protein [Nocardioides gansuensis]